MRNLLLMVLGPAAAWLMLLFRLQLTHGAQSPSAAGKQSSLLMRMHQTFEFTRRLACMSDTQLRDMRNRHERDILQAAKEIGTKQSYQAIADRLLQLNDEFCTSVERTVTDRQKSGKQLTEAFEKQVAAALPYSSSTEQSKRTVQEIHDLWATNNDRISQLLASNRADMLSTTKATIEEGLKLSKEQNAKGAAADLEDWQKQLNRQGAELVVKLHETTDRNLLQSTKVLADFEQNYTDKTKSLIRAETDAHNAAMAIA